MWLTTPWLDLTSAEGTFVRAVAETRIRSFQLGKDGEFPGFDKASPGGTYSYRMYPRRDDKPHTTYMWVPPQSARPPVATSATIGAAIVCHSTPGTEQKNSDGAFTYRRGQHQPPTNQRGPLPTPTTSVFGDWQVLDMIDFWTIENGTCEQPPTPLPSPATTSSPGWPAID